MGARFSLHNVHSFAGSSSEQGMDTAFTNKITETQYGSWTKLSLDSALMNDSPPSEPAMETAAPAEASACTQLLTGPPSVQQDSIIREVAEKLIDTDADVRTHTSTDSPTSFPLVQPAQGRSLEGHPQPDEKPALHYSLNLTSLNSPGKEKAKKTAIANALFGHFEALVEQIQPETVAKKLYGIAVLDEVEVDQASDEAEPVEERARTLLQLVKKRLWMNPGWFADVCKVLRACGVKGISNVIDDVQKKCPSEELSILSSGSPPSCKHSLPGRQTSFQDTFTKLEESFQASGLQGATDYVRQLSSEQSEVDLIHESCLSGVDVSTLDLLLSILSEKNLNINSKNESGQTPLHVACASLRSPAEEEPLECNVEQRLKIEHLLGHKASNWLKDKDGNTPLHLAVLRRDMETVSTLMEHGKKCLNYVNKRGNTALHLACKLGLIDIVKTLCAYNADTSIQNRRMRTALHLACMHNHTEVALELASHDPSTLDAFDGHRMTPLHITCKKGSEQLGIPLLQLRNCSPHKTDEDNKTPLHYACACGSVNLVSALLERNSTKAFVDTQDKYGDTALHIASRLGFREVVRELLGYKANKEIVNQEGKTPMDIAIESDHNTIAAKMLRKRGWNQRRKSLRRVRKLRRTMTQSSLISTTTFSTDLAEIMENSSDESGEDETVSLAASYKSYQDHRKN